MKVEYKTNFSGYIQLLRAIQLLIKDGTLNFTQFGVYICLVMQADYERRHKKTYGVIIRDDKEIARKLGCNYTTIHKHRKELIKKGLLIEKDGLTTVPNFHLFEYHIVWKLVKFKFPIAKLHHLFANPLISIEVVQSVIARLQEQQPQDTTISSNVSSKSDLGSSGVSSQEEFNYDDIEEGIVRTIQEKEDEP